MMLPPRLDHHPRPHARVQTAAFNWLEEQTRLHGDVLPLNLFKCGFRVEGPSC